MILPNHPQPLFFEKTIKPVWPSKKVSLVARERVKYIIIIVIIIINKIDRISTRKKVWLSRTSRIERLWGVLFTVVYTSNYV